MYKVTVQNPEKKVEKGGQLTFAVAGFPAGVELEYDIRERSKNTVVGTGKVNADANGGGTFGTRLSYDPGKYVINVRYHIYGSADDSFVIEEPEEE
ncbi:MAG: hypothetical protein WC958_05765 [Dehalococcoidales bacterium]